MKSAIRSDAFRLHVPAVFLFVSGEDAEPGHVAGVPENHRFRLDPTTSLVPGVSSPRKRDRDPSILGNDQPFLEGHGDSR